MPFDTPTDSKPRSHNEPPPGHHYRGADGTWFPSVTTILGVINKPDLLDWSNRLGFQGIGYRGHLDALARAGTLLHAKIEATLRGQEPPDETTYSEQEQRDAFASYFHWRSWYSTHTIGRVMTERVLVSEQFRYGGTLDCLAELDQEPMLLDWKSSKKVYISHALQVAAYQRMVRENWGTSVPAVVVCCPRIGGGWIERRFEPDELDQLFEVFLKALELYGALQEWSRFT